MEKLNNKKKVKVLEISHGLAPGGIESFLINIFENIDREKIEISFALACDGKQFYEDKVISEGAKVYHTSDLNGIKNIVRHFFRLIKVLKKEGPFDVVQTNIDFFNGINLLAAYGRKEIGAQLKKLKRNIHLVIATPGRLIDHIMRGTINLKNLKTVVFDEADEMLFMGFKNDIETIMKDVPKKSQVLCFSATMDSAVKKLAYRYMSDPSVISIKSKEVTLDNIIQEVVETTDRNKQDSLCKCLDKDNPFLSIIFCRTKVRVDKLEEDLSRCGYNCAKIHSDVKQSKRERIMKSFRNADIQYLIATDVAARGIDVTGVTHIYNYDIPETVESYIHRIGRCGRAGEKGYTCLFIDPKNQSMLEEIENTIKFNIPKRQLID